ncbi:APC family permease [Kyrpidia sp.]|uniref:APC family permease n=1 Tax=Kyrpidia sp. TaxID=2073077 RepID=UPI0025855DE2|nr:APC family permease [Kyrpidia sp.]MCL6575138.1 APC family permease [Kyrpidia sp.]
MPEEHLEPGQLKHNVLNRFDSVLIAVAGSAPAYSLSASTVALVAAVGLLAPGAILYGAIPMFGIALAFLYLNQAMPNSGASYVWVGRILHPWLGFLSGWSLLVSAVLFMMAGAIPAGTATLELLSPDKTDSVVWVTVVSAFWFLVMNALVMVGIHITNVVQRILTSIEVIGLIVLAVGGLIHASHQVAHPFSWSWFSLGGYGNLSTFLGGLLITCFYFWGWDVSLNLTEETRAKRVAPGLGGVLGTLIIVALFILLQVVIQLNLGDKPLADEAANIIPLLGETILPKPWSYIALIAVMISTVATLETTLIQATRTLFAMGRDKTVHPRFAVLHANWQTPVLSNIVIGVLGIILFVVSNLSASVSDLMTSAISAIGLQIAFYYGLTGISCAWHYRKSFAESFTAGIFRLAWPLVGGLVLLAIFVMNVFTLSFQETAIGLGLILVGIIPLLVAKFKYHSPYFEGHVFEPDAEEWSGTKEATVAADTVKRG